METTFLERYCAAVRCDAAEFVPRLFWRCLHRHAAPITAVVLWASPKFFAADRELLASAGRVRSMRELRGELTDFTHDARNLNWWRRRAQLRISTRRLNAVAREYFGRDRAGAHGQA